MTLSSSPRELKLGARYQHHKGMLYRVISVVRHSETLEELVSYEALYDNPMGKLWVRPKAMFLDSVLKDGVLVERFRCLE